jgi:hypothetical protein
LKSGVDAFTVALCDNDRMPLRRKKRPRDPIQRAKLIGDIATGQVEDREDDRKVDEGKNPAAVVLGRLGGLKGGKARAEKLEPEERLKIAKQAALSRWTKKP